MPLAKVPIIEQGSNDEHEPFKMSDALQSLSAGSTDQVIMQKMQDQKDAFSNKVEGMNKTLDDAYDSERYSDPGVGGFLRHYTDWGLDLNEYNVVLQDAKAQLKDMENNFNVDLSLAGYKKTPGEQSIAIVGAMKNLNWSLNYFIEDRLAKSISTADSVDANEAAFAHKMDPQPVEPTKPVEEVAEAEESWGEAQANKTKGAIASNRQALDDAMNAH